MNVCKPCSENNHAACYGVIATNVAPAVCDCVTHNHSEVYLRRQREKDRRHGAREAAKLVLVPLAELASVDHHANVQPTSDGGAFVDVQVYVTQQQIEDALKST